MMYSLWYIPIGIVLLYYAIALFLEWKVYQNKIIPKQDLLLDLDIDQDMDDDFQYETVTTNVPQPLESAEAEDPIHMRVIRDQKENTN